MERCIQFSFFLVNKPGVLNKVFSELARAKINVTALSMMDSMDYGVLRMVVDDPNAAREVFQALNVQTKETDVLAVRLSNRPGAAADLCDHLVTKHVSIGYMYCTGGPRGGETLVLLRVPDIKKAIRILEAANKNRRSDMKVKLRRPTARKRAALICAARENSAQPGFSS